MSHVIIVTQKGNGPGGSAESEVRYTPDHAIPPVIQIRKANKAARVLEKLNDYLYGTGPDPFPDED